MKSTKFLRVLKEKLPLTEKISENISTKDVLIIGGLVVGAALWVGFSRRVLPKLLRAASSENNDPPQKPVANDGQLSSESHNNNAEEKKKLAYYRYANLRPTDMDAYVLARRNDIAVTGLILWGGFGLLMWPPARNYFAQHHVGTATPGTLGTIRVLVCVVAAYMAYDEPIEEVSSWLGVQRVPMGVMSWLYRLPFFEQVTTDPQYAARFKTFTIAMLLVAATGWQKRVTLPLATTLYLALHGIVRSYTYLNHAGLTPLYALAVLCCTRSADGYSVDRLIEGYSEQKSEVTNEPDAHYAWARLAIWITIAFPYLQAGLSKVRFGSWRWWESINMRSILFRYRLSWAEVVEESVPKTLVLLPASLYSVLGMSTIIIEIGMALVPFSQRVRQILPAGTVGMHIGILAIMGIEFWDVLLLQGCFYDWRAMQQWLASRDFQALEQPEEGLTEPIDDESPITTDWYPPFMIFLLVAFYLITWALRIEFYPITASQIFIKYSKSSVIKYVKAFKIDAKGQRTPAHLWEMGRPSRDHGGYLARHFTVTEDYTYISDVLRQIGERWNANVKPEARIHTLELVLFEWDFVNNRHDRQGQPVKQLSVMVGS